MRRPLILLALLPLMLAACGGDKDTSREDVMQKLSSDVILPTYERAASSSKELEAAVAAACTTPASVKTATDTLQRARLDWKRAEAVFLGPVMDKRTDAYVDYKVDTADVERLATGASPTTLDADAVGKRIAADQRGYGALEYLLTSPRISEPRGCQYAKSIAKVAADQQQQALDAWKSPQGDKQAYKDFVSGEPTMALDDLVNDSINVLRAISDLELRAATGRNGGAGDPTAIKEGALLDGTAAVRARVEGVEAAILGTGTNAGISELLTTDTSAQLRKTIDDTKRALDGVTGSLRTASQQDKEKVAAVAERVDAVRRILATEVISQLGIALGFSDSDGDSAA
jgi:predicted lipoprotein